ncbi:hypothetical protein [Nannocystis sp. SCPEA4]|uniref:hypothetical protein n=1 Tax=Nannocystis sp. SCPEA4 TaxID=2996787 RepID=UPI00226E5B63|nr:hypothetical protein [Nannocystis sp. SCPEA4]MCY1054406.1 hypothetical protein [Nannocystis sp. SCPEA4]
MLGLRFSRLVHAAIASGALVLGACPAEPGDTDSDSDTATTGETTDTEGPLPTTGPPDPPPPPPGDITPPGLLAVTMIDPFTLQLSFTEPVASVETVNPKRFRLSLARGYFGTYGGQPGTYLRSPQYYNFTEYCPPPPPGCYYEPQPYYCYYGGCYYQQTPPIEVADLFNHYYDPTLVVLSLTTPIQPSLCNVLNAPEDPVFDFVLHLHYASGGLSQITDLAGLPLPSLSDPWVKNDSNYYNYLNSAPFSNFNPFLPIPCTLF